MPDIMIMAGGRGLDKFTKKKLDDVLSKRELFFQICDVMKINSISLFAEKASDVISVRIFFAEKIII